MSNIVDPDKTAHMSRLIRSDAVAKAYYYRLWQEKNILSAGAMRGLRSISVAFPE